MLYLCYITLKVLQQLGNFYYLNGEFDELQIVNKDIQKEKESTTELIINFFGESVNTKKAQEQELEKLAKPIKLDNSEKENEISWPRRNVRTNTPCII